MPTTIKLVSDSIMPIGPLVHANQVRVIYAGSGVSGPGDAVWTNPGHPFITTPQAIFDHTGSDFGRGTLRNDPNAKIWNSNDVADAQIGFNAKGDIDHDGLKADTIYFRFADVEDIKNGAGPGHHGTRFWFDGVGDGQPPVEHDFATQPNGSVDVFAVRTDADVLTFHWDTGHNDPADGFAFTTCAQAIDADLL